MAKKLEPIKNEATDSIEAKHKELYTISYEQKRWKIKFSKPNIIDFLINKGFYRYDIEILNPKKQKTASFFLIQVTDNKIKYVSQENIIIYFYQYLETLETYTYQVDTYENEFGDLCTEFMVTSRMLYNQLVYSQSHIFDKNLFVLLNPPHKITIKQDTKTEKFIYYNNCIVRCTANGHEILNYNDLSDGFILPTRILDRDFIPVSEVINNFNVSTDPNNPSPNFTQFLYNVSGQKMERYKSLLSLIGYLIHEYTGNKKVMIIFTDTGISENGEPDGRRGKGILQDAISRIMNRNILTDTVYYQIDGKALDPTDPISYGRADENTKTICINDVHKHYANSIIEDMFVRIERFTVKSLYYDYIDIQAKVLLSSNLALFVGSGSAKDRTIFFLFSDFYKSGFSPEDQFGERFWEHWTESHHSYKWNQYDSEMIKAACFYLKNGIIKPDMLDFNVKMVQDNTTGDGMFTDFMESILAGEKIFYKTSTGTDIFVCITVSQNLLSHKLDSLPAQNTEIYLQIRDLFNRINRDELMTAFVEKAGSKYKKDWFSKKRFTMWVKMYIEEVVNKIYALDITHSGADYYYTFYKLYQNE